MPSESTNLADRAFERLRPQTRSVLAVLTLANIWQERFPDGWVGVAEFAEHGVSLGAVDDPDTPRRAIRRALDQLGRSRLGLIIERRPSPTVRREEDRRLRDPVPLAVELWLLAQGETYLLPETWRAFVTSQYRPMTSSAEVVASLEESVSHALLLQGRHDEAINRAESALVHTQEARARRPLLLALATALLRRSREEDWARAEELLRDVLAAQTPRLDLHDRLTDARAGLSLAYCRFLRAIRGQPDTPTTRAAVAEARELLAAAGARSAALSLSDRGQVANLTGLLRKWEAQVARTPRKRSAGFGEAERHLRQALTLWRTAQESYGLGALLYNLGELCFAQADLAEDRGSEADIREALAWYEASIRYGEALHSHLDWVLDFGRAVECIALLLPRLAPPAGNDEARDLMARAETYLEQMRQVMPSASLQERLYRRVAAKYAAARRRVAADGEGDIRPE